MKQAWLMALLVGAICASSTRAQVPSDTNWHWIRVVPDDQKGWTTAQGDAPIEMKGERFRVTLDGLRLVGSVTGNKVVATGVWLDTDANPEHYVGVLQRQRSTRADASNGWGSDRISLRAGPTFVGLYRAVRAPK
jgi:hypothetical protein